MLDYTFIPSKQAQLNILICLHGFGSSKEDLRNLQFNLPNTSFIFVNAPRKLASITNGFVWFNLHFEGIDFVGFNEDDLNEANNVLNQFIEYISTNYKVSYNQISLFGFSQGGMLAFYNALLSKNIYRSVVCHSGYCLIKSEQLASINKNQTLLFVHGSEDPVISVFLATQSVQLLTDNNINLQTYIANFGHTITVDSLEVCNNFLNV